MKNKLSKNSIIKVLALCATILFLPDVVDAQQTVSVSLRCENQQPGFTQQRLILMADTAEGGHALHWNAGGPQGEIRDINEWSFFGDAVVFFHKTDDPDNGIEYRGIYLVFGKTPGTNTRPLWYSDFSGGDGNLGNFVCTEKGNTSSSTTSSFNSSKK